MGVITGKFGIPGGQVGFSRHHQHEHRTRLHAWKGQVCRHTCEHAVMGSEGSYFQLGTATMQTFLGASNFSDQINRVFVTA